MSNEIGLLLLSCVRHQRMYAPLFDAHPNVRIVAVADEPDIPDWMDEVNQEYADYYNVPYIRDVGEALNRPDIDMVSICSEPTRHARLAIQSVQVGKHVWVDKPIAVTTADADDLVAAVEQAAVKLTYVHRLYSPAIQQARAAIDRGDLGLPYAFHLSFVSAGGLTSGSVEDFRMVVDRGLSGGGELMNFMGYPIDTVRYLTGLEVEQVYASAGTYFFEPHREHNVEDFGVVCLTMECGVTATITVGRSPTPNHPSGGDYTLRIHGSAGSLMLDEGRPALTVLSDAAPTRTRPTRDLTAAMMTPLVDDFVQSVLHDRPPLRTARDGREIISVIQAAYRSINSEQAEIV